MAVAVPKRATAPAPAPSRTTPPRRKPAAPKRKAAPARPAPRRKAAPARRGQLIPLAVGRTAVAVSQLPDSSLMVRMTRGRLWIGVLGVLLAGVVALNVATLSFAASLGKLTEQITALEKDYSATGGREANLFSTERVRNSGAQMGLAMPTTEEPHVIEAGPDDVAKAVARLAAAG
jgi:hypothetical protein